MAKDLLSEATTAWRISRHPRWAAIATAAATAELAKNPPRPVVGAGKKKADTEAWHALAEKNDPLDLPRLFAALRTTTAEEAAHRVKLLWKRDDPRIVDELVAVLEAPSWRANAFKKFVLGAIEIFAAARDVRARDAMADLAPRYKAIIETTVGDWTSTHLARAVAAMADVEPKKLAAKDEARLAELEKNFQPTPAKKKGALRSDTELLDLIYAAPDDDTPRLVFADSLTERGDPRGEFISLQVRRALGQGTPELLKREQELSKDQKRLTAWALPLANGGTFRMGRGFPEVMTLKPASAKKVLGERAWATVKEVEWFNKLSTKLALEFLEHPTLAHLTGVRGITGAIVAGLRPIPRAWRTLSVSTPTKAFLSQLPALSLLRVFSDDDAALEPTLFEGLKLESLDLDDYEHLPLPVNVLAPLKQLRAFSLRTNFELRPALFEPVRLESLMVDSHCLTEHSVDSVLATQPALKRLTLVTSDDRMDFVSGEALVKWKAKVDRVTVTSNAFNYHLEAGTLVFDAVPEDLGDLWFASGAMKALVKRVKVNERPLDPEAPARVVTFFEKERGIPVER